MQQIVTYWQIYLILAASALAAFWGGWGACLVAHPGKHRRRRAAAPASALADAVTEAWASNLAAAERPHSVWPLNRARAMAGGLLAALGTVAAARSAWEAGADLEQERPAA